MPISDTKAPNYGYKIKKRSSKSLWPKKDTPNRDSSGSAFSRQRPKQGKFSKIIISVILLGGLTLLLFGIIHLQFFTVEKVVIEGIPTSDAFVNDLNAQKGKNMLFLSTNSLAKQLAKKYPQADHLVISRQFPSTLKVSVDKRQAVAQLIIVRQQTTTDQAQETPNATVTATVSATITKMQYDQYYIDSHAVAFARIESGDPFYNANPSTTSAQLQALSAPTVFYLSIENIVLGTKLTDAYIQTALNIITESEHKAFKMREFDNFNNQLPSIQNIPGQSFEGTTDDGILVVFSSKKPAKQQVDALQIILASSKIDKKKIGKIDVRFNKPTIMIIRN